jgi:hypothetical protein
MHTDLHDKRHQISVFFSKLFSRENIMALILALILIGIYILTAADAPLWLYQGF